MKYVPFMICVIVFLFTSAGYFITDKKTEKIYGALSIVSIACAIKQTEEYQKLDSYPSKNCIAVIHDIIVIKLPEE